MAEKKIGNKKKTSVLDVKSLILKVDDIEIKPIDLSKFGIPEGVYCKTMDSVQYAEWQDKSFIFGDSGVTGFSEDRAYLAIVYSACDEKGDLIFTEDEISELKKKSGRFINAIAIACMAINGFSKEAVEKEEKK